MTIFYPPAVFGALAIASALAITERAIDHCVARSLEAKHAGNDHAQGFRMLFGNRPMLILAAALACFHLGNDAILPLYGLAVVGAG